MEDDSLDIRRWLLPLLGAVARWLSESTTSSSGSAGSAARPPGSWPGAATRVLGLERFALGHSRGASHDTSRILRHSYHTPAYVRLTQEAYADWARARARGRQRPGDDRTGGLDLFPPDPAIPSIDYTRVDGRGRHPLRRAGRRAGDGRAGPSCVCRPGPSRCSRRTPRSSRPAVPSRCSTSGPAARRGAARAHARARAGGPRLVACGSPRRTVRSRPAASWSPPTRGSTTWSARSACTSPSRRRWSRSPTSRSTGRQDFADLPLWIWMDDPSFYGFPPYGEPTVKAAQDCGGPTVVPGRPHQRPGPRDGGAAGRAPARRCCRASARRSGRCAASTRSPRTATS